jgi:Na+-translocating ferredoxin:NAD+ oxidoreductase RnfC subunit
MLYVCFSNQRPIQQQEMILGNQFTNTVATKTTSSDTHECNQTCTDKLLSNRLGKVLATILGHLVHNQAAKAKQSQQVLAHRLRLAVQAVDDCVRLCSIFLFKARDTQVNALNAKK